jgi:arginine decarboxylase
MKKGKSLDRWNTDKSAELYGIRDWGAGYFDISKDGEVVVVPPFDGKKVSVSLMDVVSGIRDRGMDMPVLLRFENLLDSQIRILNESFRASIKKNEYKGKYQGVFPIKVNQQQQVIEEISRFGERYSHGLEAGSKAELIAALAMLNEKDSLVICNGYKDEEFIDLGLNAIKMGYKCFFVLEMPGELAMIIERSKKLKVRPIIGVRLKLSARANGHWTDSGGDRSIFGLTTTQLIDVVDTLKKNDLLDCLKLLHYHLGSQIPNIRDIRSAVVEACRYYVDLVKEGAPMGYMDMGGGLAVDYDGSQTNFVHSRNYTLDEYTTDIIEVIKGVLDEDDIAHPTVITESGRAIVAYHSVLLFNILDVNRFEPLALPDRLPPDSNEFMLNLQEVLDSLTVKNLQECYNDALYYREEIRELFKHGTLSLRERSLGENLFLKIMREIHRLAKKTKKAPPDLEDLQMALSDIYYCNFSVFQSLPDAWAIDQIFPIIPLHRLKEEPTREAILADITCDCDGKIDRFVDIHDVKLTLPLHETRENEEYYLGVFLVGAYQETLGDLHNLLGDTNVVSIRIHETGQFDLVKEIEGDSIADVLSYVEYNPKDLQALFRAKAEGAVRNGLITASERKRIVNDYEESLRGYTYYER